MVDPAARDTKNRPPSQGPTGTGDDLYRRLAKNFPNGAVLIFDHNLRFTLADGAGLADVNLSKELMEGKTIWEVFPPETSALLAPPYSRALAGEVSLFEVPYAGRIYQVHVLPIRGEGGEIQAGMAMAQEVTEAKRAETALRESQQRYEQLVNSLDGLVWEADAQTFVFSFVSRQVERLLGYPAEEWLRSPTFWQDHIYPEDRAWTVSFCTQATAQKRGHELEYRMVAADGRIVWLRDIVTVVIEHDLPVLLRGVMVDITERKRAEQAIEERARLAAFGEAIGSALTHSSELRDLAQGCAEAMVRYLDAALARIWTLDKDGEMLSLQASAGLYTHLDGAHSRMSIGQAKIGRIAGLRREHWTNDLLTDPQLDDPTWAAREGLVAFAGYPLLVQEQLVGVMALFARRPLSDLTLEALSAAASSIAIGIQRSNAEKELREREEQYRSVFESTSDGLLINELAAGRLVDFNPAASRMFGYSADEFRRIRPEQIVHPDSLQLFREYITAVKSGDQYRCRAIVMRKDGSHFHVEVAGVPFTFRGHPHGLAVIRDITEEVQAYQLLEERVEERTRALYEQARTLAALEERQKLARDLHDSVSQAIYGIGLGAQTARAMLDSDPANLARPLDYVVSLADAALTEMRALIFELRPESLKAEGLVAAIDKQTAAIRARYRLEITTTLCAEPPVSLPVKEAVYRIAQEALHNVVKHARASRVDLHLEWHDKHLRLVIEDNGLGFNTSRSFPGHLGLHSMRERVAQIGGKFSLASAPGRGTRIDIEIPAA